MLARIAALALGLSLMAPAALYAQDAAKQPAPAAKKTTAAGPKAGPGQKVCNYRFPDGERRTWVCAKEEPCCAWDAIKYVKCGSTITKCL